MKEEFKQLLEDTYQQLGRDFGGNLDDLAEYMAERTDHLALISTEPGFGEAVLAERDNVVLRAGLNATRTADLADQRIVGVITGALRIAAVAAASA